MTVNYWGRVGILKRSILCALNDDCLGRVCCWNPCAYLYMLQSTHMLSSSVVWLIYKLHDYFPRPLGLYHMVWCYLLLSCANWDQSAYSGLITVGLAAYIMHKLVVWSTNVHAPCKLSSLDQRWLHSVTGLRFNGFTACLVYYMSNCS
jgi:hypothetical protein